MRSTLACASCRRSKIRCVNDGTAPCRACRRTSREPSCVLSVPERQSRRSRPEPTKEAFTGNNTRNSSPKSRARHEDQQVRHSHQSVSHPLVAVHLSGNPIEETPLPVLIEAAWLFVRSFPGVSLIHTPSYIQTLRDGTYNKLQACALLAVCGHLIPELRDRHGSAALAGQYYAQFVRGQLDTMMRNGPHVDSIQCLLLLGMYEWGAAHGFNAWMYTGMAIRMAQALRPDPDPQPFATNADSAITQEVRNRTIWSCFTMDRLLSCGKGRPSIFVSTEMQIPLPLSELDYAFGDVKEQRRLLRTMISDPELFEAQLSIQDHFTIILRGIDIWATLAKWSNNGSSKRQYNPEDCPWLPTSTWNKINRDINTWRTYQEERVKYSPIRVTAQMHQGHPEAFAFINLLYYLCLIFLHREFVPLLPLRATGPAGPAEPPFLRDQAPPGWWESSAEILHHAAQSVADIFSELDKGNVIMMTPLAAFSAFSAAITLSHVAAFPHINLGRSPDANKGAETLITYLTKFGNLWKIGEDWVSTLADARHLFARAASSKLRYGDKSTSLGDQVFEYGSIYTTQVSSSKDLSPQVTNAQINSSPGVMAEAPLAPNILPYDTEPSEFPGPGVEEVLDFDEEIWRLNDALLGEQYLTSFIMGNEPDRW